VYTPRSCSLLVAALFCGSVLGQGQQQQSGNNTTPGKPPLGPTEVQKCERVLAARREYRDSLEQLRLFYIAAGDLERAKWAEDELIQFHRIDKHAFRLDLDVPPPDLYSLKSPMNIAEANELFRRAMLYKDKGWGGNEYIDNSRRAELLFQQILSMYPLSDKCDDAAYQLGDLYEGKAYKHYRRAALYFERCFQWNPQTDYDARLRAARLYDKYLHEREKAMELYRDVITHETNPKRTAEAQKRLNELSQRK
jgi:tetratricopeptide (TPR) repeat protein